MSTKDTTFTFEGEDAVYLVEYDSEGASGDDWDEPKTPARAWIHQIWLVNPAKPAEPILIDTDCLNASLVQSIEEACGLQAFPEPPEYERDDDRDDDDRVDDYLGED